MTPGEATATDAHLRAAFARVAGRPRCPATLAEALAHPTFGVAIRAVARRIAAGGLEPTPAPAPVSPPPTAPASRPRRDLFDPKSAAANDRPHDDD